MDWNRSLPEIEVDDALDQGGQAIHWRRAQPEHRHRHSRILVLPLAIGGLDDAVHPVRLADLCARFNLPQDADELTLAEL